jgi:hypothetical protein
VIGMLVSIITMASVAVLVGFSIGFVSGVEVSKLMDRCEKNHRR